MKLKAFGFSVSYTGDSMVLGAAVVLLFLTYLFVLLPMGVVWSIQTLVGVPYTLTWPHWFAAIIVLLILSTVGGD